MERVGKLKWNYFSATRVHSPESVTILRSLFLSRNSTHPLGLIVPLGPTRSHSVTCDNKHTNTLVNNTSFSLSLCLSFISHPETGPYIAHVHCAECRHEVSSIHGRPSVLPHVPQPHESVSLTHDDGSAVRIMHRVTTAPQLV
jgi:hypothetical protein